MTNQPTIAHTFSAGHAADRVVAAGVAFAGVAPAAMAGDPLLAAAATVARLGTCSADYDALSDADALNGQKTLAQAQHELDTRKAWMAKTLAQRSRWELGQSGLAAQQGFLSPEALIQKLTGTTKVESRKLVGVGRMLAETEEAESQAAEAEAEAARRLLDEALDPASADGPDPAAALLAPRPVPWHAPISHAVSAGILSIDAAHALRTGLGDVDTVVTGPALADALERLLSDAESMNVDQLVKRARQARDSLDEAGIRVREQKAWDDRYLRIWTLDTGQVRVDGLFPPEQGEFIKSTFDSFTSPRRGGVRFVDTERAAWAKRVREDPRTTSQITCDGFVDLLRAGTTVNPHEMLGGRRPAVQILTTATPAGRTAAPTEAAAERPVTGAPGAPTGSATGKPDTRGDTEHPAGDTGTIGPGAGTGGGSGRPHPGSGSSGETDLGSTDTETCPLNGPLQPGFLRDADDILICLPGQPGHGYIEGNNAPVSPETIERLICDSGTVQIRFDEFDRPLNLGHEQRLFTRAQRRALAARDGGCRWPGCDRPPAFTEAHHIEHWQRDRGRTDVDQGILLCHAHHLLLHNQRWQIFENTGRYWLRPPATVDPGQSLIEMPSRTRPRLTRATLR